MKFLLSAFISLLLLTGHSIAQPCISPEAENFYQKAMKEINQKHINWVKYIVASIDSGKWNAEDLPSIAGEYRHETHMDAMDIEGLMALVMFALTKETEADLRDMLDQMKKQNEEKKKLRDAISRLKKAEKDQKEMLRSEYDSLKKLSASQAPVRITTNAAAMIQPKKVSPTEIHALLDSIRDKEDSLNEVSELLSLRIQMYQDRYSKYMSMLSNLMKKVSDTADSIIANLK